MKIECGISVYTLWACFAPCSRTQLMEFSKIWSKPGVFTGIFLCVLFSNQCIKKTDSKEIFKDDFNRANLSSLGSKWTTRIISPAVGFQISNNQAQPLGGTVSSDETLPSSLYTEKVKGSFKVSAKFSISGGANYFSSGYLIGRSAASDAPIDSYLCGYYFVTGSSNPYKYNFSLRKESNGVVASFGDVALHQLVNGISDKITLTFDGNKITCAIEGNSTISISLIDSSFGDGYTGITGGGNSTPYLYFDDFLVEKL